MRMDQCLQAAAFGMFCKLVKIRLPGEGGKTEQRRDKVCRKRCPIIPVGTLLPPSMSPCSRYASGVLPCAGCRKISAKRSGLPIVSRQASEVFCRLCWTPGMVMPLSEIARLDPRPGTHGCRHPCFVRP